MDIKTCPVGKLFLKFYIHPLCHIIIIISVRSKVLKTNIWKIMLHVAIAFEIYVTSSEICLWRSKYCYF